jgi:hypothetical protein
MPGRGKYKSIKHKRAYTALKKKGMSKSKAAAISNALANGTLKRRGRKKR